MKSRETLRRTKDNYATVPRSQVHKRHIGTLKLGEIIKGDVDAWLLTVLALTDRRAPSVGRASARSGTCLTVFW